MQKRFLFAFLATSVLIFLCACNGGVLVDPTVAPGTPIVINLPTNLPLATATSAPLPTASSVTPTATTQSATATLQPSATKTSRPAATATTAASSTPSSSLSPTAVSSTSFKYVENCGANGPTETSTCRVLINGKLQGVQFPAHFGWYFDYSPASHAILFATSDTTRGAGPSNLSVHDLAVLDISSGKVTTIFKDPIVVKAFFAPNGFDLAYIRATQTTYELRLLTAKGDDRLLAKDVPTQFGFSPAGDQIAFARESRYPGLKTAPGLYIVPTAGGQERKLSNADRAGAGGLEDRVTWSPDGKYFLFPVSQDLYLVAANGSVAFPLTFDPALSKEPWYERGPNTPANRYGPVPGQTLWHPDGQHLVGMTYTNCGEGGCLTNVVYMGLDLGKRRIVSGKLIGKGRLLTWDTPGESVWIESFEKSEALSLPIPK